MGEGARQDAAERTELIEAGAKAGQELAIHWGHPPWSDSWARQVAETMHDAFEVAYNAQSWRCECDDLNRRSDAFCYRCGAGQPEVKEAGPGAL